MAQQIGRRAHAFAALRLKLRDPKALPVAAGHLDALLSGGKQRTGRLVRSRANGCFVNFEPLARQFRRGAGPGDQSPHLMAATGFVQSIGDSSRDSMGAKVACAASCGVRGAVPAASRGRASASASAPTFANRSHREG